MARLQVLEAQVQGVGGASRPLFVLRDAGLPSRKSSAIFTGPLGMFGGQLRRCPEAVLNRLPESDIAGDGAATSPIATCSDTLGLTGRQSRMCSDVPRASRASRVPARPPISTRSRATASTYRSPSSL